MDDGVKTAAYLGLYHRPDFAHANKEYATMQDSISQSYAFPIASPSITDALTEVLRQGAQQLLIQAVEAEVAAWIDDHATITDERGRRQVVRNGHADSRKIITGVGQIEVTMSRVHDRRPPGQRERFTSKILPPYLRKAKSINELPKRLQPEAKDREQLLTFYDFPAEHWKHLRTTNPIKSTFATVRLRHRRTKGNGSRRACLAMVFRLCQSAEKRGRRLNGHELIQDLIAGVTFTDGEKQQAP